MGTSSASRGTCLHCVGYFKPEEAFELIEGSHRTFDDLSKTLGTDAEFQQHCAKNERLRQAIRQKLNAKRP